MPRESKKSEAQHAAEQKPKSLQQLTLDKMHGKYELVSLASIWALELRRREENRHLSQVEILDLALMELLTGRVSTEEVQAKAPEVLAAVAASIDSKIGKDEKERK